MTEDPMIRVVLADKAKVTHVSLVADRTQTLCSRRRRDGDELIAIDNLDWRPECDNCAGARLDAHRGYGWRDIRDHVRSANQRSVDNRGANR